MTYFEEAKLEAIYNGGYEKQFKHGKYRFNDDCDVDCNQDEYRDDSDSGTSISEHSMHFE